MKSRNFPLRLILGLLTLCTLPDLALCQTPSKPDSNVPAGRQILRGHLPEAVSSQKAFAVGRLPLMQHLNLAIGLPLRDRAGLEALLHKLYDPNSPSYRQFLTVAEFTERFAPTQEDYQAVIDFAKSNGLTVTDTPSNRLIVDVEGPVANIEH